jgi:hypothetical protein
MIAQHKKRVYVEKKRFMIMEMVWRTRDEKNVIVINRLKARSFFIFLSKKNIFSSLNEDNDYCDVMSVINSKFYEQN